MSLNQVTDQDILAELSPLGLSVDAWSVILGTKNMSDMYLPLSADVKNRVAAIVDIRRILEPVYTPFPSSVGSFLRLEQPILNNKVPLDLLGSDHPDDVPNRLKEVLK